MISDGGRFMVERCWGAEKTLDGARMKAEMIEYIKAYETEVATLESANARLTAELSALRAEKAELDSGMHEMRAYRDGYDPNERVPELGQKILVYYGGDFALYTCFDENRLVNSRGYRINADYPDRWWPLPAGKGGE